MLSVRFLASAERDARRAARYYEDAAPGHGVAFRASLQRAIDAMSLHPELGVFVDSGLRALVLDRFPFRVMYRVNPATLVIVAVAHDRRRPGYWRG